MRHGVPREGGTAPSVAKATAMGCHPSLILEIAIVLMRELIHFGIPKLYSLVGIYAKPVRGLNEDENLHHKGTYYISSKSDTNKKVKSHYYKM